MRLKQKIEEKEIICYQFVLGKYFADVLPAVGQNSIHSFKYQPLRGDHRGYASMQMKWWFVYCNHISLASSPPVRQPIFLGLFPKRGN